MSGGRYWELSGVSQCRGPTERLNTAKPPAVSSRLPSRQLPPRLLLPPPPLFLLPPLRPPLLLPPPTVPASGSDRDAAPATNYQARGKQNTGQTVSAPLSLLGNAARQCERPRSCIPASALTAATAHAHRKACREGTNIWEAALGDNTGRTEPLVVTHCAVPCAVRHVLETVLRTQQFRPQGQRQIFPPRHDNDCTSSETIAA